MNGVLIADVQTLVTLFMAMAVLFFLLLASIPVIAVLLGRAAYRRVRRDPRWNRTTLAVREKCTVPGPRRDLVQLRLRLGDAVASARQSVAVIAAHGGVQGELMALVRRLDLVAASLDTQLHLMQSETNGPILRELIAPAHARVAEIEGIARHIRTAAYATVGDDMDYTVAAITADVEREVIALQAGVSTLRAMAMDQPAPVRLGQQRESYR